VLVYKYYKVKRDKCKAIGEVSMSAPHDMQFKLDAVAYRKDHSELGIKECAENLGIGRSTLSKWTK